MIAKPSNNSHTSLPKAARRAFPALYEAAAPVARGLRRALALRSSAREIRGFLATVLPSAEQVPMPRVVLDGAAFQNPHGGIARLWDAILAEWSQSGFAAHVVVLDRARTAQRYEGFTYRDIPAHREDDFPLERQMLQTMCEAESASLFVSTLYTRPTQTPSLLFVHDLTPEILGWDLRQPIWKDKAAAIHAAAGYVCNSRNTADDLHRLYPESASRALAISVPGVGRSFRPADQAGVSALRDRLELPERYFVFIGHRDIHKNAELVFEALALLQDDPGIGLLLVGGNPALEPRFAERAGRIPVRIAELSDSELKAAYTGSSALLYVSRYEGFGLAILEAMACGCPVITCRNSAIPEAAGDAVIYVGEDDPEGLRRAMLRVLEPPEHAALVARGLERAATFPWGRSAQVVEDAIRSLAGGTTGREADR